MVMLRPSKTMSSSDPSSVPLAFMWQVNSGSSAERHLRDAASRLGLRRFSHGTASNGTGYQTTTQGIGYAIRNGWAIASASIRQTLDTLSSKPTHTLADIGAYKRGVNGPFTATSAFYVDVRGFRKALEDALLPGQTQANRSQYTTYVVPFIAPIRSVSGSTGTTRDGKTDTSTVVVDIGSESRS